MGKKESDIMKALFGFIFPTLSKAAIKLIEEIIKQDLNNDGKIGFDKKEG